MRQASRRRAGSAQSHVAVAQVLENRVMLSGHAAQEPDGTLIVTGTDAAESLKVTDLGDGTILVEYQDLDDLNATPEVDRFFFVPKVQINLLGGHDEFQYLSENDATAALRELKVDLGAGNDLAHAEATLFKPPPVGEGTTEQYYTIEISGGRGDDSLTTILTTLTGGDDPTQPVQHVELHGDAGRDTTTFIANTATGGFTSKTEELESSSNPECQIWDLIDGTTGEVNGRVRGFGFVDFSSSESGIGRANLDLTVEATDGNDTFNVDLVPHDGLESAQFEFDGRAGVDEVRTAIHAATLLGSVSVKTTNAEQSHIRAEQLNNNYSENMRHDSTDGISTSHWIMTSDSDTPNDLSISTSYVGTDGRDAVEITAVGENFSRLTADIDTGGGRDTTEVLLVASKVKEAIREAHVGIHNAENAQLRVETDVFDMQTTVQGHPLTRTAGAGSLTWNLIDPESQQLDVIGTDGRDVVDIRATGDRLKTLLINVDTKGGDDELRTMATANSSWDDGYWLLDFDGGTGVDSIKTSFRTNASTAGDWEFLAQRAERIGFEYTLFREDGVPLRAAVASLSTTTAGDTLIHGKGNSDMTEEIEMVIEQLEHGSVRTRGFGFVEASIDNDDLSIDFSGRTSGEVVAPTLNNLEPVGLEFPDLTFHLPTADEPTTELTATGFDEIEFNGDALTPNGRATIEATASGAYARDEMVGLSELSVEVDPAGSDIDVFLNGYEAATVSTTFFDGRMLTAAGLKVETVNVPNLDLTVAVQGDSANVEDISFLKIGGGRGLPYFSQLEFALSGGTPSYRLVEENISGFQLVANLPEHQLEKEFLMAVEDVFDIGAVYNPDEISFATTGISGAAEGNVHIAATDPAVGTNIDLNLKTAEASRDRHGGHWLTALTIADDGVAEIDLQGLAIEQANLNVSGVPAMTRSLSHVDVVGEYSEAIVITNRDTDADAPSTKPLLIIAEDVEIGPGAQFQSNVQGAVHVIRRTENLTLGDGSSFVESISATADANSTDTDKRKQSLYFPEDMLMNVEIGLRANFVSHVEGSNEDDFLTRRWQNIINRGGTMISQTDTGDGADTAIVFVGGYGIACYQYANETTYDMGSGHDRLLLTATDIVVPEGASFATTVLGGSGRDIIEADVNATVDGTYQFLARGGRHADHISTTHELTTRHIAGSDGPPPEIRLMIQGDSGNDDLTAWLIARDIDDDGITALINGGRGRDACAGNISAINCEH